MEEATTSHVARFRKILKCVCQISVSCHVLGHMIPNQMDKLNIADRKMVSYLTIPITDNNRAPSVLLKPITLALTGV